MSILGNRVLRREDPKFLTTGGVYVADVALPDGAVAVSFVRSTAAHARIVSIELDEARKAPGVLGAYAAGDIDIAPMLPGIAFLNQAMTRPVLASGVVRFVGEPVAMIVSETASSGADAAELVAIDYEPLQAVVSPEEAAKDETLLFADLGSNNCFALQFGHDDNLFDGCEVVASQRIVNQRVAPCPLEVRSAAAYVGDDGRLTFYSSTQAAHAVRDTLAGALGLPPEQIRVIAPDVGGGFGAKATVFPEDLLVAWAARELGRPVRWVESRSESMLGLGHGRAQVQEASLGGTRDGHLLAYRLDILQDSGAYPSIGAMLPYMTRTMATGVYSIARAECSSNSVVTNTAPLVAYRGAGRPEATAAIERMIDLFSLEAGLDPAEVRRRNLIAQDAFPYTTPTGTEYDSGDYTRDLDLALEMSKYKELRAEQRRRRTAAEVRQLGIGLSTYVEITNGVPEGEFGAVEVRPDGKVTVRTGTSPHGQGHMTAWSMLVADRLGVPIGDIEVIHGDTDIVPRGVGTFGSRSLQIGGAAVDKAAGDVVEIARGLAADLLEADSADIVLDKAYGRFHVTGTPALAKTWAELASASAERHDRPLMAEVDLADSGPTFPFGAHVAVVEVDTETGHVELLHFYAVDDAGRLVNPLLAEGQVHGGIAQGAAQALVEEFVYDRDGNPLTANFADYPVISAAELPSFETAFTETATPKNSLEAKGIGESATIGSTPAVQNAVIDALSHLGIRHIDMPATPQRVWAALCSAKGA
ncbi:MAG: xanthine dehydrogenase family protein molybdopterin-binding subunit [Acidimicrobiales bacterium]